MKSNPLLSKNVFLWKEELFHRSLTYRGSKEREYLLTPSSYESLFWLGYRGYFSLSESVYQVFISSSRPLLEVVKADHPAGCWRPSPLGRGTLRWSRLEKRESDWTGIQNRLKAIFSDRVETFPSVALEYFKGKIGWQVGYIPANQGLPTQFSTSQSWQFKILQDSTFPKKNSPFRNYAYRLSNQISSSFLGNYAV